ncbi:hypothetical protein [Pilimelia columellifera]|uniref:Uncharacterized protein n=1 Tax=Pilimelia columellifera subsp. columellifera TaxID=706583 RepID=A0ABN3N7W0_9ACTN
MSDFDSVLERLVTDPGFAAALAANPTAALSGYQLDDAEAALLRSQAGGPVGAPSAVEQRTSQSSVFGLLSGAVWPEGAAPAAAAGGGGSTGFGPASSGGGTAGFGPAPSGGGVAGFGPAPSGGGAPAGIPDDYRTRVDADGDGRWDAHRVVAAGHGVDLVVDADAEGIAEFVGHDRDADGRIDAASYDHDGDGRAERTMVDDDGDGWLDRAVTHLRDRP